MQNVDAQPFCILFSALLNAYILSIFICMRTTLNIDDTLLDEAMTSTGIREKTAVIRMGLEALIERSAARRLMALGGTMPNLEISSRRRQQPKSSHGAR